MHPRDTRNQNHIQIAARDVIECPAACYLRGKATKSFRHVNYILMEVAGREKRPSSSSRGLKMIPAEEYIEHDDAIDAWQR